jgi:hypothetical protein
LEHFWRRWEEMECRRWVKLEKMGNQYFDSVSQNGVLKNLHLSSGTLIKIILLFVCSSVWNI